MGIFDKLKKKNEISFIDVDSNEKAIDLANKGVLKPLYLMPLRFSGEESAQNRVFVPQAIVELKDRYDDIVEELLIQEKVNGYLCTPEYKGNSFIPSKISLVAKKDGIPIFTETINVW